MANRLFNVYCLGFCLTVINTTVMPILHETSAYRYSRPDATQNT